MNNKYLYKGNVCGHHCIKIKDFGVKIGNQVIIEHINLHIHCGQLTSIIGKNGAGKSTLLKAILNEVRHEGTIDFTYLNQEEKNGGSGIKQELKIGYVPQSFKVAKNTPTSVYDLFASFITKAPVFLWKSKKAYEKIKKQLERFDGGSLIDKAVCDLSGGELQRVLLSIATYGEPNLLILDEPVSGIDLKGMELFYRNIDYLKKHYDLAIIMVSHDLEYAAGYSDYVVLLDQTIVEEGSPEKVLKSRAFQDAFGIVKYREGV